MFFVGKICWESPSQVFQMRFDTDGWTRKLFLIFLIKLKHELRFFMDLHELYNDCSLEQFMYKTRTILVNLKTICDLPKNDKEKLTIWSGTVFWNGLKSSPQTCVTEMLIFWSQKNTQFTDMKFTPNKVGVVVNPEMLSDYRIILLKKAKKVTIQLSANPKLNCLLKIGWNSDMEFLRNMVLFKIPCTPISFIPKEICCLLVLQISN